MWFQYFLKAIKIIYCSLLLLILSSILAIRSPRFICRLPNIMQGHVVVDAVADVLVLPWLEVTVLLLHVVIIVDRYVVLEYVVEETVVNAAVSGVKELLEFVNVLASMDVESAEAKGLFDEEVVETNVTLDST